jgi:DHA1 family tetracycline resistance protein-like MFS transporter
MGILGACIGLGFVFGPAIGAGFSVFGFGTAAFVASGLAGANLVFAFFRLPESRGPGSSSNVRIMPSPAVLAMSMRSPALGRILTATFLATFAFAGLEATLALFSQRQFGLDARGFGLVFTYLGVVIALVQGGLVGRLSTRYGERALAAAGAVIMCLAFVGITFAPSLGLLLVALGAVAVGQGFVSPTLSTLLSRQSHRDEQGGTLGLGQSFAAAARATGPLLAGWLFDRSRFSPYLLGASLVLLAGWLVSQSVVSPESVLPQDTTVI